MRPTTVALLALASLAACRQQAAPDQPAATPAAPPAAVATQPATPTGPPAVTALGTVPELPDYPAATLLSSEVQTPGDDGFAKAAKRKLLAAASFDEVKRFYATAIAEHGWTIASVEETAGKVEWDLTKGSARAELELKAQTPSGVKIEIKRQDR